MLRILRRPSTRRPLATSFSIGFVPPIRTCCVFGTARARPVQYQRLTTHPRKFGGTGAAICQGARNARSPRSDSQEGTRASASASCDVCCSSTSRAGRRAFSRSTGASRSRRYSRTHQSAATVTATFEPRPGLERTSKEPPTRSARSFIPRRPRLPWRASCERFLGGEKPRPLSDTDSWT